VEAALHTHAHNFDTILYWAVSFTVRPHQCWRNRPTYLWAKTEWGPGADLNAFEKRTTSSAGNEPLIVQFLAQFIEDKFPYPILMDWALKEGRCVFKVTKNRFFLFNIIAFKFRYQLTILRCVIPAVRLNCMVRWIPSKNRTI